LGEWKYSPTHSLTSELDEDDDDDINLSELFQKRVEKNDNNDNMNISGLTFLFFDGSFFSKIFKICIMICYENMSQKF
jgi:hypothetical protein